MSVEDLTCFDPSAWYGRLPPLQPDSRGDWYTRDVIGPLDACRILHIREMIEPVVRLRDATMVDMFLLSVGEPPSRRFTKIGGLPFWPKDRDWPKSSEGRSLSFLAQFNFSESRGLVGFVPEDLLVLFWDEGNPSSIIAKWQSIARPARLVDYNDMMCRLTGPCFFGTRWRVEAFPEAVLPDVPLALADGTKVWDLTLVCHLMGMQIGPRPFFPRLFTAKLRTGNAVCGMSSILPVPGLPFPFLNRSRPLTQHDADSHSLSLSHIRGGDGFGAICVVLEDSGEPRVLHEDL